MLLYVTFQCFIIWVSANLDCSSYIHCLIGVSLKQIFEKFYSQLVKSLPMKDVIFVSHLVKLLPGDLKEEVESKSTTAKATTCFLDNAIKRGLECGDSKPFLFLLSVMDTFDSGVLKELSMKIRKDMQSLVRISNNVIIIAT